MGISRPSLLEMVSIGWSAARSAASKMYWPSPATRARFLAMGNKLLRQGPIGLSDLRCRIVGEDRLPFDRSLLGADAVLNGSSKDHILERRPDFLKDLLRMNGSDVVHGDEDAPHFEARIEFALDAANGFEEQCGPTHREVVRLDGDEDVGRSCKRIGRQKTQAGRAVDEDVVI